MAPRGRNFQSGRAFAVAAPFRQFPPSPQTACASTTSPSVPPQRTGESGFSDLSVVDARTGAKQRKTISVNVPLRRGGVTVPDGLGDRLHAAARRGGDADRDGRFGRRRRGGTGQPAVSGVSDDDGELVLPANLEGRVTWGSQGHVPPLNPDEGFRGQARRGESRGERFQSVAIYASDGSFAGFVDRDPDDPSSWTVCGW